MKRDSWTTAGGVLALVALCAALSACSSPKPKTSVPDANPKAALNPDCSLTLDKSGARQISCPLFDSLPDMQADAAHPGSSACSATSFSVFKQTISTPLRLVYGQKGDDGPLQVRVGGVLGPGTHAGRVGKSAGNDCDATIGPVVNLDTRFSGSYVAVVDKSQRPACVAQSKLVPGSFEQTLSAPLKADIAGAIRGMSRDALQKRLDLEVATQVNKYLQPSGRPLAEAVVNRHGRCPEGFRTFTGQ